MAMPLSWARAVQVPEVVADAVSVRTRTRVIPFLDAVRGLSALYVLAFHVAYWLHPVGARLQEDYGAARLLLDGSPAGLLGFGHQAVLVFFVLSGFVIHLRQAQRPDERAASGGWAWLASYARRRAIRIYVPLVFALTLTAAVGLVGSRLAGEFFGQPVLDRVDATLVMNDNIGPVDALSILLPIGGSFGSNGPLWSIQYEIWFYIAYVVVLFVLIDRFRIPLRWILTFSALAALTAWLALVSGILRHQAGFSVTQLAAWFSSSAAFLIMYFPVWLAGALLAELYSKGAVIRHRKPLTIIGVIAATGGATAQIPTEVESRIPFDYVFALGAVLLMALALLRPPIDHPRGRLLGLSAYTANWSYSLYIVHFPIILLVRGMWLGSDPVPPGLALPVVGFVAGLSGGIVTWRLVDRPALTWAHRRSP